MTTLRAIAYFSCLFILLSSSSILVPVEMTYADKLVQGAYWTYEVTSKSELQGTGRYEGRFTTAIAVAGRSTVQNMNTSALVMEKRETIRFSIEGGGYYKQDPKSDQVVITETCTIDRQTLTYKSRTVRYEAENKEEQDKSAVGSPAIELVPTSLAEGQQVQYLTFVGKVNCSVSYGSLDFQGSNLPAIILRCSGSAPRDPWLEADGAGDHTFKFEKSTGLLTMSSSRIHVTGEKGTRQTTYDYRLNSTSLWTKTETQTRSATTTPTPEKTTPTTTSTQGVVPLSLRIEYVIALLASAIGVLIIGALKTRKKAVRSKLEQVQTRPKAALPPILTAVPFSTTNTSKITETDKIWTRGCRSKERPRIDSALQVGP